MKASQILSRRTARRVDFRPDADQDSPHAQLRRLASLLGDRFSGPEDLDDESLDHYREYIYRKIFTGTTHEQFVELDESDPTHIDWAIATHEVESENFRNSKRV